MAVGFSKTNKPLNPRGNDASPKGYNRAALYSGKALDFDGVNDKITGTASVLPTGANAFSTCFYVNKDADTNGEMVFWGTRSVNQANGVMLTTGRKVLHTFFGNDLTGSVDIEISKWYFVCVTFDGTTRSIYINGQLDASDTPSSVNVTGTSYQLGYGGGYYHNGELANTKVFNTALTAAQVADLYNNPEKIVPTGVADSALKLWLPMQEGAGTTAYDGSGNGNHGTISGATWTHGIGAPVAQTAVIDWNKGTNLVAYSNELDNAYWIKGGTTISSNYATAPDGSSTADKIVSTSGTGEQRVYKTLGLTTIGNTYTYHAFVKADGANYLVCRDDFRGFADTSFDLVNGVVGTTASGRTASITAFGDYYFISVSATITSSVVLGVIMFCLADVDDGRAGFIGDGTKGIVLWGAGITEGTSKVHIPTLSTAQTSDVLLPQGLTSGRDITGVNLFENVRKQGALNLDGNSWAEVHDNASLDVSEITAEGWMYAESITTINNRIVNKWNSSYPERSFQLYGQNATINWMLSDGSSAYSITGGTLTQGQWHHVVGTYDGSTQKIYLNGVQVQSTALSITLKQSSFKVMLGGYTTGLYSLNPIAQPRIYNRALTAAEVLQNYNSGKSIYTNS